MKKKFRNLKYFAFSAIKNKLRQQLDIMLMQTEIEKLRKSPCYQNNKSLIPFGHKIYSQFDEDGIIREIFNRIQVTNKTFVEIGIGDGLENNTLALLFDGWRGLWIEASRKSVKRIKNNFSNIISNEYLKVINSFVNKQNINKLISSEIDSEEIDLLSIDIDGNDFHVFNAIKCIKPRVVIIEYNAKFQPAINYCMDYDESHVWQGDDCFGASLKFLEVNFLKSDYCLVGCSLSGVNAFFVRNDLVSDKFLEPFSSENHYEPARYFLINIPSGHRPSYQTLQKSQIG